MGSLRAVFALYGRNDYGNLGFGTASKEYVRKPRVMQSLWGSQLKYIAAGTHHSCIVLENGQVFSWGRNIHSAAAQPETDTDVLSPLLVQGLPPIERVSCGDCHTAAIAETGEVYMWGWELAQSMQGDEFDETALETPTLRKWPQLQPRHIECGPFCTAAIDITGKLYTWGLPDHGLLGHGNNAALITPTLVKTLVHADIRTIRFGKAHAIALTNDGVLFVWGSGPRGQLGLGRLITEALIPTHLSLAFLNGARIAGISCGDHHTVVWTVDGQAYSWGICSNFRLGYEADEDVFEPTLISSLPPKVITISCGALNTVSVHGDPDRSCYRWGGMADEDHCISLVTTQCRVAVAGKYHTLLYTGKYAHPQSSFFPRLSNEDRELIEQSLSYGGETKMPYALAKKRQVQLFQYLGWCKYTKELNDILIAQASEDLARVRKHPLLGAEVDLEVTVLGLKIQGATEHHKDREYFKSKGRGIGYEETVDTDDQLEKYLEF